MSEFNKDIYTPSRIVGKDVAGTETEINISEDVLYLPDANLLDILLTDRSTGSNIIWATDNYSEHGEGYGFSDEITPERITGNHNLIIQPRIAKDKAIAADRTKEKAEVFTPLHIVKKMNDIVDDDWFHIDEQNRVEGVDSEHAFDTAYGEEVDFSFAKAIESEDAFTQGEELDWTDYVTDDRLEITCGEAPYLVSRYDATTGEAIPVMERYGILDRKLRIVSENTDSIDEWILWAKQAYQHTYGYEWQGDSILLARENMLATALDHFYAKFSDEVEFPHDELERIAEIISWNNGRWTGSSSWCLEVVGLRSLKKRACSDSMTVQSSRNVRGARRTSAKSTTASMRW